jgi:hypothetical protein
VQLTVDIQTERPIRVSDEIRNTVALFEGEAVYMHACESQIMIHIAQRKE